MFNATWKESLRTWTFKETKLWCQCELSMTDTLQQLALVSNLKDGSFRMVFFFFCWETDTFLKTSSSLNAPWGRDCLFDKAVCVPTWEIRAREKHQTMQKKKVLRFSRWRNRLFPAYLVWWLWKVHIQWCLSAKQAPSFFPSPLWSVMTPPH